MDLDTETLIALVSSLLNHVVDHEKILEALVRSEGDVQQAADVLNKSNGLGEKRKRQTLDGWVKKLKSSTTTVKHVNYTRNKASLDEGVSTLIKPKSTARSQANSPTVDLMTVLRPPLSKDNLKRKIKSLPPLMLSNSSMIAEHTPCTLHLSILPPELACQLFYTMLEASKTWQRNKWWLFDRIVESPHRTSFYTRLEEGDGLADERDCTEWQEAARFWYNGRMTDPPKRFPPEMEVACKIIEQVVNEELKKRNRYSLEHGGNRNDDSGTINPVGKQMLRHRTAVKEQRRVLGFILIS